MMRPMPLLDLAFLWIDRPETPSNVGVLMLLDPPDGTTAAAAAARIVRAYRAARPAHPFDAVPDLSPVSLPHWRSAGRVDMRKHVLRARLAAPGSLEELCRHVARLHEEPLDRSRPLFSVHVIDGLASGQLAVYLKSHHASWDGRYALERVFGRLRRDPGPVTAPFFAAPSDRDGDAAAPPPGSLASGMRTLAIQAAAARELFGRLAARGDGTQDEAVPRGNRPFAGPHTRFSEPVSAGRSYACFSLPIAAARRVARAWDATLNDVALAVVDAGVERFLATLGERPRQPLVAMCPVSLRDPGDREATTKVATLFVPLARPRSGIGDRMRQVAAHTRDAKTEFHSFSREAALDYALLAFGLWFASNSLGLGAVARPVVNLVVSNVGAIEGPRYLGDCRLTAAYPVSMLADPCGLNVTLLSVDSQLDFGIVANAAVLADAFDLARACERAFAQLCRAVPRTLAPRQPAARRSRTRISP